jgi:hypothetical protein
MCLRHTLASPTPPRWASARPRTNTDQRETPMSTIEIDGVAVRCEPVTLAQLYCGCTTFFAGHDVEIDALACCPEPDTCPGTQKTRECYPAGYELAALSAIQSLVRTHVVG